MMNTQDSPSLNPGDPIMTLRLFLIIGLIGLTTALFGCPGAQVKPTQKKNVTTQEALDQGKPTPAQLAKVPCANPRWVKPPEGMQDDTKKKESP